MKRFIIIISFVLFCAVNSLYVSAQNSAHEFSAYSSLGLSSLRYQVLQGTSSGRFGGDFGLGYTFYRSNEQITKTGSVNHKQWGVFGGLGLGLYNAKATLNSGDRITDQLKDDEGDNFILTTNLSGFEEIQKLMCLNIPVMVQFNTGLFYAMGGIKASVPLKGTFQSTVTALSNEAYYPDLDNWAKSQTFAGYGAFSDKTYDGKFDLGVNVMLAFEAGINMSLSDNFTLYCGAYFDYGLNNAGKGNHQKFVNYYAEDPENFTVNSVLSSYSDDRNSTTFTDKIKAMAVGVKIRVAYRK